jgi:hypothetical protein
MTRNSSRPRIAGIAGLLIAAVATAGWRSPDKLVRTWNGSVAAEGDTIRKGPPWCLAAAQPDLSRFMHQKILMFATAAPDDSTMADARAAAGNMPITPAAQVTVVTDEVTCRKASRALDDWFWTTAQGAGVHLVKVGQRYVILAPGANRGEFHEVAYTDSRFAKLALSLF